MEIVVGKTYTGADRKIKRKVTSISRGWVFFDVVGGWTIARMKGSIQVKHFTGFMVVPTICECGHQADCHDGAPCGICDCEVFKERA